LLAQAHRAASEPQLARDALVDAVRFKPEDASLRLLLAADMADSGDTQDAAGELDEAIRQSPRDARAYDAMARLAMARHDLDSAEKTWRALLAATPHDVGAWLDVAGIRQLRHDPRGALAVFDLGEKDMPDLLSIPMARAEWLARTGHPDAAIAEYERLIVRAPDDASIANNLAWILADSRGDRASLARALSLVERFAGDDEPGRLDTLGWIQLRLGQAARAATTLERAALLAPDSPLIQMHLGMALHAGGDAARGDALLRKVLASKATLPHRDEAQRLLPAG
jgi:predicted Zn-dependent protease